LAASPCDLDHSAQKRAPVRQKSVNASRDDRRVFVVSNRRSAKTYPQRSLDIGETAAKSCDIEDWQPARPSEKKRQDVRMQSVISEQSGRRCPHCGNPIVIATLRSIPEYVPEYPPGRYLPLLAVLAVTALAWLSVWWLIGLGVGSALQLFGGGE
jgi:hypothetical protein